MRTQTAGEVTVLDGANYAIFQRVKVANGSATLIDYSDYLTRVTIDEDIDQPTAQATVEFRRDASSTISLAPLRTDSTLNVLDDAVTYSPALDAGRLVTIEAATVAIGATPGVSDWKPIFRGYLDSVDAATPTVVCVARDEGGVLVDRWIETEKDYASDTAMETVMQEILDDTLGSGVVTLYTPTTPSFLQRRYTQQSESLMDALRTFAQQIGWDVRYKWDDGTSAFRLTLYEPDRANTTPDRSFTAAMYYEVTRLILDRVGVRNRITIDYPTDGIAGPRETLTVENAASQAKYGIRFMGITESNESSIDTVTEATNLVDAVLSDLKDPKAEMEIEAQFFWPAQLGDLYRFPDNDVHFNTNQDWAVTNVRHDLYGGTGRTYLQVRGTPAGGYLTWRMRDRRIAPPERPRFNSLTNFREVARTATQVTFGWNVGVVAQELWLYISTEAQPVSGDPFSAFTGTPTARLTPDTASYALGIPATGYVTYGRLVPVDANGVFGQAWDFTVQPNTPSQLLQRARALTTTATTVVVRVAVADPHPSDAVDVSVAYTATGCTVTEASPQTIAAAGITADIDTTGTVDFTVTRPAFGSGTGRVAFTASASGRLADTDAVDIPAVEKTTFGPTLIVTPTPGASSYSIAWSGDAVTLSIDGAAYGTPGASPITVTRNAANGADKIYAFKAVLDGQTVTDAVTIPAIGAVDTNTITPDLTVTPGTQTSTTQPFTISGSNPSGGAAPTLYVTCRGTTGTEGANNYADGVESTFTSGQVLTVARPSFNAAPASVNVRATLAGSNGTEVIQRTILNQDKLTFGPTLVVTPTPGASSYSIVWSGDSVTVSIDGAAYAAPPASPISVARNVYGGADKIYSFRAVLDGQTVTDVVVIPAQFRDFVANPIITTEITDDSISTPKLKANAVEAGNINVTNLAAINADLGTVTSGYIQNSGNTAAIRMSGTTTLPSTNYLDFTSTGTAPFIKTPNFEVTAAGTVTAKVIKLGGDGSTATLSNIDAFWNGTNTAYGTATGGMVTLGRTGSGTGTAGRQVTVTFPTAYSTAPYIALTPKHSGSVGGASSFHLGLVTTSAFDIYLSSAPTTTGDDSLSFTWVVIE